MPALSCPLTGIVSSGMEEDFNLTDNQYSISKCLLTENPDEQEE